jgi:hypothetical protein
MKFLRAVLLLAAVLYVVPATAQTRHADEVFQKQTQTHVYLMRGLFGIYSLGMDSLAKKFQDQGYRATVYGYESWNAIVQTIHQNYEQGHRGPVAVIGHSLGANAVFDVANELHKRQIPVLLGVIFDATERRHVPANVDTFMNFFSAKDGFGHSASPGPGFGGVLENHDLSATGIDHVSIDELDPFHKMIIGKLTKLVSR